MTSIYVSIPNCLDKEYYKTLDDIFLNSDNPNNIYVGTAHSIPFKNKKHIDEIKNNTSQYSNIRFKFLNHYRNSGVGYGRKESMSMYDGEDYILQIDSHTMLKQSWDTKLIEYYNNAKNFSKNKNKTILSTYLSCYKYYDNKNRDYCFGVLPPYSCYISEEDIIAFDRDFDSKKNWKSLYSPIPRWVTPTEDDFYNFIKNNFVLAQKISANFIFSNKTFAEDYNKSIPFPFIFFEEEFIMSVELYNLGYSFIYPNFQLPLAHLYADNFNEFYSRSESVIDQNNDRMMVAKKNISDYLNNNQDKIKKYAKYAGLTYPELNPINFKYIPER